MQLRIAFVYIGIIGIGIATGIIGIGIIIGGWYTYTSYIYKASTCLVEIHGNLSSLMWMTRNDLFVQLGKNKRAKYGLSFAGRGGSCCSGSL